MLRLIMIGIDYVEDDNDRIDYVMIVMIVTGSLRVVHTELGRLKQTWMILIE